MKENYIGTGERGMGGCFMVGLAILFVTALRAGTAGDGAYILWIMCAVFEFFVAVIFIYFLLVFLRDRKTVKNGRKDYGVITDAYIEHYRRRSSFIIVVSYTTDSGAKRSFRYQPDRELSLIFKEGKRVAIYVNGENACMDPEKADVVFDEEKKKSVSSENKSAYHPVHMDVVKDE